MSPHGVQNIKTSHARSLRNWGGTGLAAIAVATLGVANLSQAGPIMNGLNHLGYPPYLARILGAWYVLAAIALLAPGLGRAKEWAYAGLFLALTGAAASHAFNHDPLAKVAAPLALLTLVMLTRADFVCWNKGAVQSRQHPGDVGPIRGAGQAPDQQT